MSSRCDIRRARSLRLESLEPRFALAFAGGGVTVITHGAQFLAGLPDWTVTLGQAILDRADGAASDRTTGSLFQHNPDTGLWQAVGDGAWVNSNDPSEHIVLLYDWSDESGTLADGWLDAAADNLFASLLAPNPNLGGALGGTSFFAAALASGDAGVLNLHFIGHSRGAVLNSQVAARFDENFDELAIDHVTTLDAHPAGPMNDIGYVPNTPSTNSRVFTYDNVRFADNYYQSDGSYEPVVPPDFDGVIANGAYNFQIPSSVLASGGAGLSHSDVHTWYYGTVTEALPAGYSGFSGAGRNHDGDVGFPESWWGGVVAARGATGFAFSEIVGARPANLAITGAKIDAAGIPTVVDGDLARGADGFFSDSLPGWERHGGGGTAPLGGSDLYFELNSGGDDYFRRHNPLYLPRHTTAIEFDYWVTDADATDDRLQVLVGGSVVEAISLASTTSGFVRDRRAAYLLPIAGQSSTIEFRLADLAGDGVESAVRIDNVSLVIQPPAPSADFDASGRVDGGDFLAWQRGFGVYGFAAVAEGDADQDGNVIGDDFAAWRATFGAPASAATASSASAAAQAADLATRHAAFAQLAAAEAFGPRLTLTRRGRSLKSLLLWA